MPDNKGEGLHKPIRRIVTVIGSNDARNQRIIDQLITAYKDQAEKEEGSELKVTNDTYSKTLSTKNYSLSFYSTTNSCRILSNSGNTDKNIRIPTDVCIHVLDDDDDHLSEDEKSQFNYNYPLESTTGNMPVSYDTYCKE